MATLASALADPERSIGRRKSGTKPTPRRKKGTGGTKKKSSSTSKRKPRRTAACSTTSSKKKCYKKRAVKACKARVTSVRSYKVKGGKKRVSVRLVMA